MQKKPLSVEEWAAIGKQVRTSKRSITDAMMKLSGRARSSKIDPIFREIRRLDSLMFKLENLACEQIGDDAGMVAINGQGEDFSP